MKALTSKRIQQIPEGVQDTLPDECYNRRKMEERLRDLFNLSGYDEIDTPLFEYLDLFEGETASIEQETMYKFFEPGDRIMVLRPDITMPIARIAATKMKEYPLPLRLSYIGSVYRYEEEGQSKQREIAQAGIELLGSRDPMADAEVIALSIESLLKLGLRDFQIDIGQVEFFKGLVEEAGLDANQSEDLRHLIDQKNSLALEILLKNLAMPADTKNKLLQIPMLFGASEVLDYAKTLSNTGRSKKARENIGQVCRMLSNYGLSDYIAIDLGMVHSPNYYTGIIFRGMIKDMGYPICSGGRYDTLVSEFGLNLPATGFALETRRLLLALERQKGLESPPATDILLVFDPMVDNGGYDLAKDLRSKGQRVEIFLADGGGPTASEYATKKGIGKVIEYKNGQINEYRL
ncbi:MAG: ATP phosphoribosyltransferase regulatory subunit [Caldicoprobacterales bacterium]